MPAFYVAMRAVAFVIDEDGGRPIGTGFLLSDLRARATHVVTARHVVRGKSLRRAGEARTETEDIPIVRLIHRK